MEKQLSIPAGVFEVGTTGSIYFIGTATVLLRYAGFTTLTDPNFIHRHEQVQVHVLAHGEAYTID